MVKIVPLSHSSDELEIDVGEFNTATLDAIPSDSVEFESAEDSSPSVVKMDESESDTVDEKSEVQAELPDENVQPAQKLVVGAPTNDQEPKTADSESPAPISEVPEKALKKSDEKALESVTNEPMIKFSGKFDVPEPVQQHWVHDESDAYRFDQSGPIAIATKNEHQKRANELGLRLKINGHYQNDTKTHVRIKLLEQELLKSIQENWPALENNAGPFSSTPWSKVATHANRLYGRTSSYRRAAINMTNSQFPRYQRRVFDHQVKNNNVDGGSNANVSTKPVNVNQPQAVIDLTQASQERASWKSGTWSVQDAQREIRNARFREIYPWTADDHAMFFRGAFEGPQPMSSQTTAGWPIPHNGPSSQPLVPRRRRQK